MRKTIMILVAFLTVPVIAAVGTETTLSLDISRRNTSLSFTASEFCDFGVRANILRDGSEFNLEGWEINLVFGGTSSGCVHEGVITGYNEVLFTVPASSLPTNGRYTVQIMAMKDRVSNEWGRGNLRVNINPGMEYMPTCWMGYQKVARLAASMISLELITNQLFAVVLTNTTVKIDAAAFTNHCLHVTKSNLPEMPTVKSFVWDRSNSVERVFRSYNVPGAAFILPEDWKLDNSRFTFETNGVTEVFMPQRKGKRLWYHSTTSSNRYFMIRCAFVPEAIRNKMLFGE